jgi:arylformamidase
VWPGDRQLELEQRVEHGVVVSALSTTCHVGTHVDAPLHLDPCAAPVDRIPLDCVIGDAEVVHVRRPGPRVGLGDMAPGWSPQTPRVLLRTDTHPLGAAVGPGFAGLGVDLVHWLADHAVELVGIDTPSVDPFDGDLRAHHALANRGVTWIEGLWLGDVDAGCYRLVALPLPLVGVEAAPVRAVLGVLRE